MTNHKHFQDPAVGQHIDRFVSAMAKTAINKHIPPTALQDMFQGAAYCLDAPHIPAGGMQNRTYGPISVSLPIYIERD